MPDLRRPIPSAAPAGQLPKRARRLPACIFDQDQHYRTDLPYLVAEIDEVARQDMSFPAGWDAVAAVLALCCGPNLGRRLESERGWRGGLPEVISG